MIMIGSHAMSDLDKFKESIWQKHHKNHDSTLEFGAKVHFNLPKCTPNSNVTASFY